MNKLLDLLCTKFLFVVLLFSFEITNAQTFYQFIDTISVYNGNHKLKFPFSGGLNNPQFSSINYDNDAHQDFFIFDRTGNKILVFKNDGIHDSISFSYQPKAEFYFPNTLANWVLMRDMNGDGESDIVCQGAGDLIIYLAKRNIDNTISYTATAPFVNGQVPGGTFGNIYSSPSDIPAIDDINHDGDMDILIFDVQGNVINYWENQQVELYGHANDSMKFNLNKWCWGKIIDAGSRPVVLNYLCNPARLGSAKHSGNTLATIDIDGDGDKDCLKGNLSYNSLTMLYNGGDSSLANINYQDTIFPANNNSFACNLFAASFFVDVNNDSFPDLLAAPNNINSSENRKNVWYYQHSGTKSQQPFNFKSDSFLVSEMIDVGSNSYPAFLDFDNDGLNDLMISSGGTYDNIAQNSFAQLFLYKNVGSINHAKFQLISNNFMNLKSWHQPLLAPTFGDVDGDGLIDMLCGLIDGKIMFFKNTGTLGSPQFTWQSSNFQNIDVGDYATPQFFDFNNDGLLDLACGNMIGTLSYFKNVGTNIAPSFTLITSNFGGVDVKENGDVTGFSAPFFFRFTNTSPLSLLVGNEKGHVYQYENISSNLVGNFNLQSNYFSQINCGERATPTANQLIGNDSVEIICGTNRGGVQLYSNGGVPFVNRNEISFTKNELKLYPNPATNQLIVMSNQYRTFATVNAIEVINVLGLQQNVIVERLNTVSNGCGFQLNTINLISGIYFIKVVCQNEILTAKFVIKK
ncbi:MAG: hypothetical protein RJA07_2633 [Bacteroidota bacterium]|jgi:hypothetical protein